MEKKQIKLVVEKFFGVFNNCEQQPDWNALSSICLDNINIIKSTKNSTEVYTLESFLTPRIALFESGRLQNFAEQIETINIDTFEKTANVRVSFTKKGVLDGSDYSGKGTKMIQLVKIKTNWIITAVAWYDQA